MPIADPGEGWINLGRLGYIQTTTTPRWVKWNDTSTTTNHYIIPTNYTSTTGDWRYTWNTNAWFNTNTNTIVRGEDWYTVGYETPDPNPVTEIEFEVFATEDREIERAAAIARNQYLTEERRTRALTRTEAINRATELLLQLLSQEQAERYRLTGAFEVIGSAGNVYRIHRGVSGNIEWIKPDGQVGARLCAHPEMRHGWLPDQDVALAQMLALTTDEPSFIQTANVHAGVRPPIGVAAA